jgi:hypothetical protein
MKVLRCGSAAFGSVVEDCPAGTEIGKEPEKSMDLLRNGLAAML